MHHVCMLSAWGDSDSWSWGIRSRELHCGLWWGLCTESDGTLSPARWIFMAGDRMMHCVCVSYERFGGSTLVPLSLCKFKKAPTSPPIQNLLSVTRNNLINIGQRPREDTSCCFTTWSQKILNKWDLKKLDPDMHCRLFKPLLTDLLSKPALIKQTQSKPLNSA